jgi:hypothetical protein
MSRWKIERRGPGCHECDRPFEDGERHACTLTLMPFSATAEGIELAEAAVQVLAAQKLAASKEAESDAKAPKGKSKAKAPSKAKAAKGQAGKTRGAKAQAAPEAPDPDAEVLVRRDLCSGCWQGDEAPEREADLFWWLTRHQERVSRSVSLDLDSLELLFLQLEGNGERPVRELRYVLCLLLMRKRRIKVERVLRDDEGESFLVKRPRRDERYKVYVYDFDAERMAEIRDELQAIFDGAEAAGVSLAEAGENASAGADHEVGTDVGPDESALDESAELISAES